VSVARRFAIALAIGMISAGCNLAAGIPDFVDQPAVGGGGAGGAGGGGAGGAGGGGAGGGGAG
jgi:hypothetical protein